jgi:excisionase family DNA binding protein
MPDKSRQPSQPILIGNADNKVHQPIQTDNRFEPLLDAQEAARLLRMHPRTLRTKARSGAIPGVQVGRRWRFRVSALNKWLERIAR